MRSTFQNSGSVVSIGVFFSIITISLAAALPVTLSGGLIAAGVPVGTANQIARLPPTSALFAAFLGYNPIGTLVPPAVQHAIPAARLSHLLGHEFFPNLISGPFMASIHNVIYLSVLMCLVAALASLLRGKRQSVAVAGTREIPEPAVEVAPASSSDD